MPHELAWLDDPRVDTECRAALDAPVVTTPHARTVATRGARRVSSLVAHRETHYARRLA